MTPLFVFFYTFFLIYIFLQLSSQLRFWMGSSLSRNDIESGCIGITAVFNWVLVGAKAKVSFVASTKFLACRAPTNDSNATGIQMMKRSPAAHTPKLPRFGANTTLGII
ncbi:hypothetical protein MiSe_17940 [Microseira wollei NIES-4236]|uniref:Secreted protein n=1 Tax=Microseira wollei NIES-4236 TaxID=2530354 RepID=A0AAV3X6W2_9CYAN|nr:hypothetical protein MiSe_17940 [Microseira wollei NIES-4236]